MKQKRNMFPAGVSTVLMPSVETTSSYTGLTPEQKREMLTHSLVSNQQNALLPCKTLPETVKKTREFCQLSQNLLQAAEKCAIMIASRSGGRYEKGNAF